jgi:iron complex outermembrane receptor protein
MCPPPTPTILSACVSIIPPARPTPTARRASPATPADVSIFTGISPGQNTGGGINPRVTEVFSYSFRTLAGLRGRLGETWEWESAVVYSGAQTHEFESYQIRESRLRAALNRTDATAFNPFPVTFKIATIRSSSTKRTRIRPRCLIRSTTTRIVSAARSS